MIIRFKRILIIFHERVYHVDTLSLIGNIASYSYNIRNGVIPILALMIMRSTKKTEERYITQLFKFFLIKLLIILNNILIIN